VRAGRNLVGWASWGAGLGYGLPLLWASIWLAVPSSRGDAFDGGSLAWALLFVAGLYTLSGLGLYAATVGACCGLASAWLPRAVRAWQRGVVLAAALHVAGFVIIKRELVPPIFVNIPGPF
jgi:hypothetical protein